MHLYNFIFKNLSILFFFFLFKCIFPSSGIYKSDGMVDQHVLAVCALLTWVILKGLTLRKCVFGVRLCTFCFMFCVGTGIVDCLNKEKSFEM